MTFLVNFLRFRLDAKTGQFYKIYTFGRFLAILCAFGRFSGYLGNHFKCVVQRFKAYITNFKQSTKNKGNFMRLREFKDTAGNRVWVNLESVCVVKIDVDKLGVMDLYSDFDNLNKGVYWTVYYPTYWTRDQAAIYLETGRVPR